MTCLIGRIQHGRPGCDRHVHWQTSPSLAINVAKFNAPQNYQQWKEGAIQHHTTFKWIKSKFHNKGQGIPTMDQRKKSFSKTTGDDTMDTTMGQVKAQCHSPCPTSVWLDLHHGSSYPMTRYCMLPHVSWFVPASFHVWYLLVVAGADQSLVQWSLVVAGRWLITSTLPTSSGWCGCVVWCINTVAWTHKLLSLVFLNPSISWTCPLLLTLIWGVHPFPTSLRLAYTKADV